MPKSLSSTTVDYAEDGLSIHPERVDWFACFLGGVVSVALGVNTQTGLIELRQLGLFFCDIRVLIFLCLLNHFGLV